MSTHTEHRQRHNALKETLNASLAEKKISSERKEALIPGDDWASQEHSTFTEIMALSASSYPGHTRVRQVLPVAASFILLWCFKAYCHYYYISKYFLVPLRS